jgi:hypothetical protein
MYITTTSSRVEKREEEEAEAIGHAMMVGCCLIDG